MKDFKDYQVGEVRGIQFSDVAEYDNLKKQALSDWAYAKENKLDYKKVRQPILDKQIELTYALLKHWDNGDDFQERAKEATGHLVANTIPNMEKFNNEPNREQWKIDSTNREIHKYKTLVLYFKRLKEGMIDVDGLGECPGASSGYPKEASFKAMLKTLDRFAWIVKQVKMEEDDKGKLREFFTPLYQYNQMLVKEANETSNTTWTKEDQELWDKGDIGTDASKPVKSESGEPLAAPADMF